MLTVRNLHTEYPNERGQSVKAASDISFSVPAGALFTLLGPSGCGKTTTLRSIAGLERPTQGEILVDGKAVYSSPQNIFVPPNRRNFGMVFQSYAIWPHMNVFQNAAFPLQTGGRKFSRKQIEEKVMRVLDAVGLEDYADRPATKMSGGQQQRLALARALVMEPKLLLLDEPLSNLDAKLRQKMRFELKRMQRELGLTTIYVTHDQGEALALSHEIAVMNAGRIVQIGTPRDIYGKPHDRFVADFVGVSNFFEATVLGPDGEGWRVESQIGQLCVIPADPVARNERILISVRPEEFELSERAPEDGVNVVSGKVDVKVFLGEFMDYQIKVGDREVLARTHPSFNVPVGAEVFLRVRPEKCITVQDRENYPQAA
jgi:iron(III) transport system ATP-binding protein